MNAVQEELARVLLSKLDKIKEYVFDECREEINDNKTRLYLLKFFRIARNVITKDPELRDRDHRGIFADWLAILEPICEYYPPYQRLSEYVLGRELLYDWERGEDL